MRRFLAHTNELPAAVDAVACGRVVGVVDQRAASGTVVDPRLPGRAPLVQRVPHRPPLWVSGRV